MFSPEKKPPLRGKGAYILEERLFFSNSEIVDLKPSGRLTIPIQYREYAKLESDILIIGAGKWIEVWNLKTWENEINDKDFEFVKFSQPIIKKSDGG